MKTYKVEVTKEVTRWYNKSNQLHREDGPAVEYASGYKFYYINGKCHREDGPAVKYVIGSVGFENGDKLYYINGKLLTEQEFKARDGKTVIVDGINMNFTMNIGKPKGRYVVPCFAVEQTEEATDKILNGKEYDSLGGWTSKTGTYHLSANYHFISLSMALKWAKIKNQEAIFDLETRETIYL
jgi:hypothetical protein